MLVVGEDIKLNEVILTHSHTLVGCFGGHKFNSMGVKLWVLATWQSDISTVPEIFLLTRGWIAFKFPIAADSYTILAGLWRWEGSCLLLK